MAVNKVVNVTSLTIEVQKGNDAGALTGKSSAQLTERKVTKYEVA